MNVQRNFKAGFVSILALFTLLCFASIVTVEQAAPQKLKFFAAHMQVQESLQKILLILSALDGRGPVERQSSFAEELTHLRKNVEDKDQAESAALDVLEQHYPAATLGDPVARLQILRAIEEISQRQGLAFQKASEEIRLSSVSSGWALAFLGIVGFLTALTILSRFKSRILDPLTEVISVIEDWNSGNRMRRFNRQQAAPELRSSVEILNDILDHAQVTRSR